MKITLLEAEYINFKGLTKKLKFNPGKNVFLGKNGTFKTTVYDGIKWLLDGKDSSGSAKFDIKTVVDGEPMSKTDHSVFATYDIDGRQLQLGKTFAEVWKTPRGATEQVKDGNKVVYIVDGEEVKANEFQATISGNFGPWFKLVSDPKHASTIPWKELREIISGMATGIDKEKIIDSIADLRKLMNGKEIEKAKTIADQRKKKIKELIANIPAQIAENKTKLDSAGGISLADAKKAVVFAGAAVDKAQKAIDDFNQGDNSEAIEELRKLNGDLVKAESDFQEKKNAAEKTDNKRLHNSPVSRHSYQATSE